MGMISWLFRRNETASERPSEYEIGMRTTPERATQIEYSWEGIDYNHRAVVADIRRMDKEDGRVKRIHNRVARDVTRGGLVLLQATENERIKKEWRAFEQRLELKNAQKLKSDARGLVMEGNLPIQWVLNDAAQVARAVRMPSETIRPNVQSNGQFKDVHSAYAQHDYRTGQDIATFALWQMTLARLDPDNYDDLSCLGRPFLDASREIWRKLRMTDTDLVIRRHHRSPMRLAHVLENATREEMENYRESTEANKDLITTDFYLNKKGGVSAVQGDATMGEIGDVVYLLDSFFAGSPLPKGLMGYTDGMARDILEDLKRDYYDEVDQLQDVLAWAYTQGFRLHLLLQGINPDGQTFNITFAERRTETLSQTTDRALKLQALGMPQSMIWEEMGYNAGDVEQRRTDDAKRYDPYPQTVRKVSITPGNAPKGESATNVSNR